MPARPPRTVTHPERKLRRIPRQRSRELAAKHVLKGASFYYNLKGNVFAIRATRLTAGNIWLVDFFTFSGEKAHLRSIARMRAQQGKLLIESLRKVQKGRELKARKGEMVFRAVLNEAIKLAGRKRLDILIEADKKAVSDYYRTFGFDMKKTRKVDLQDGVKKTVYEGTLKIAGKRKREKK